MAIGPVQLLVLGFVHPDFHGEVIAELERLKESDTVRVIDALAVHKDAAGEIEVMHLSNLSKDEAIELGSKVGALIGLGIEGEEGAEIGAQAGAEAAAEDGINVFTDDEAWDVIADIPNDSAAASDLDRAPLGGRTSRRYRPRRRIPHLGWVHQPVGSGRNRTCEARRRQNSFTRWRKARSLCRQREDRNDGTRRVARRTSRRVARRR